MEKKKKLCIVLGTLSAILLVGSQYLNNVIELYLMREGGCLSIILFICFLIGGISVYLNIDKKINFESFYLVLIIACLYIMTQLFQPNKSSLPLNDLLGMCLMPILLGSFLVIDYKWLFRGCMFLLVFAIPVFNSLFLKANKGSAYDAITMSTSYNILPIISAGVIYYIFFRKEDCNGADTFFFLLSLVFMYNFILMCYRGPLLSLVVLLFLSLFFAFPHSKRFIIAFIVFPVIAFVNNFNKISLYLYNLFLDLGINIAFLAKTIYLLDEETFDHGRSDLYEKAFDGFLNSPLWGNGIATFEYYTGYPFPHNLFLEILFDGGLALFGLLAFIFYRSLLTLFKTIRQVDKYRFAFVLMIGCIAVTRSQISAESWRIILLWFFIGLTLNKTNIETSNKASNQPNEPEEKLHI